MSALNSAAARNCKSSINRTTAVCAARAAAPTDSSRARRSCCKTPLSANPLSASLSRPTSRSGYRPLRALAKPARARSARSEASLDSCARLKCSSTRRNSGARRAGSERSPTVSRRTVRIPAATASSRMRSSNTVLPTPRKPTISTLWAGRRRRIRSIATRTVRRYASRPASSAGDTPGPGVYGLRTGSIHRIIDMFYNLYNINKKDKIYIGRRGYI